MSNGAVVLLSDRALAANVDRLGEINAELAALNKKATEIKNKLIDSGLPEIEGRRFRAVISPKSSVRLDQKLVRAFLSPEEIKLASKVSESVSVSLFDL